jgi:dienelactone hydrolase
LAFRELGLIPLGLGVCFVRLKLKFLAAAALACAVPVAAAPLADAVALETFAALPSVERPQLSPDGTKVAALVAVNGKQSLVIASLFDANQKRVMPPGEVDINWWRWVNDDWLVIGIGDTDQIVGEDIYVTRVAGVKADMSKLVPIHWKQSGQDADDLLWVARDGSPRILLQQQTGYFTYEDWYPSVWEADVSTGQVRKAVGSQTYVYGWDADADGNVRLGLYFESDKRRGVLYRPGGTGKFEKILLKKDPEASIPLPQVYRPDGKAVVIADDGGRDEIYEMDLPSFTLGKKLFGDARYDVDDVIANTEGNDLDGIEITDKRSRVEWLNPEIKAIQKDLDSTLGAGNAEIVSWSRDHKKLLVRVGGPSHAGSLFYWDTRQAKMNRIGWMDNMLKGRALSPVKTVSYTARDGTPIEAVLTLPRGRAAKNLPLIMMPHGGPGVRDSETYDWWVQFLAEQGYAVMQPNYRGSTGYGVKFLKLGEGEWGLKMQDDLLDGIGWAAKEGIVDPKRVCIVGASYGGYAAMRGAQRDAAHYRCAIAYAGISDLSAMKRYDQTFLGGGKAAKRYWNKQVSDFSAVSPRFQAAQFGAPILIAHGVKDKRVPVKQSRWLVEELKKAGKPHEYLEQKLGDHHFSRAEDRLQFLKASKAFLDRHNPS